MTVSFQTIDGAHYLCAEDGGGTEGDGRGRLVANREAANAWEQFTPKRAVDGRWGFQADSGAWLSAQPDGTVWANREKPDDYEPDAWEAWVLQTYADGRCSLKSDHGYFLCAEGGGGSDVNANRTAANAWEAFLPSQRFWIGSGGGPVAERPSGRLSAQGRFFVLPGGHTYRPVWASYLSALRRDPASWVDGLSEYALLGFNGVRVFAGALTWAGQSPELARERLPQFLDVAGQLGLRVEVVPITDSGTGYNVEAHARAVADICRDREHVIIELANEYWHPTQSAWVRDPRNLSGLRQSLPSFIQMSLGAPGSDEPPLPGPFAEYLTLHLDRGRDKWNQVRRVRELEAASATYGKPVVNNEPIGADELDGSQTGRQRFNDPAFFFCLGALNRIFEVGGVFHSQAGLQAEPLGPVQTQCAQAFVSGFSAIDTQERLAFKNAGWSDSPVKSAAFDQTVIRAYSGITGNRGWLVLVGLRGDPRVEYQNGWRPAGVVAEMSGCQILRLER
jgi:hypothetical protein